MSRFQKNSLLALILLASIAYPPLYYSILDTVEKESLPKSYNHPKMIPHVALGAWEEGNYGEGEIHSKTIRNLVSLEFQKMSNLVYYGKEAGLAHNRIAGVEIRLLGKMEIQKDFVYFFPKINFTKYKKSYSGIKIKVSWVDIGTVPIQIARGYIQLITESIRLNRYQMNPPVMKFISNDLNTEILSHSDYQSYATLFASNKSIPQIQETWNTLLRTSPKVEFLNYERLGELLNEKGTLAAKEIWKEWGDIKLIGSPFSYLLAYRIATLSWAKSDWEKQLEYFQIARREREKQGRVFDPEYVGSLSGIGRILLEQNKNEEALFYLTSAKDMYEALRLGEDVDFHNNQIFHSILLARLGQRELALNEFFRLEPFFNPFNDFERALFYYNFAKLEYSMGSLDASLFYSGKARSILFQKNLTNHELNFHILSLYGSANYRLGNFNTAQYIWEEILSAEAFLSLEEKSVYRSCLYNMALIYQKRSANVESDGFYKQYVRLTPYSEIIALTVDGSPITSEFILPGFYSIPNFDEFTDLEETIIKSSTGRYIFGGQEEEIRARTYQNRLEDTNEFLRDLLTKDYFGTQALTHLKERIFAIHQTYEKGANVVFIDIGPALNNIDAPGITSQSVAYHFPKMEVILWELPSEVELFLKKVPADKKEALYSFQNIRVLSGDGVGKFEDEYSNHKHWLFNNRSIPNLKNKTIIFRAANSIDIYETFQKIQPHFKDIGKTLKENPVLYFFNRSILLKPGGEEKFTLIGYQSVRGFHHNFQSLDRNGEPPYTLANYTLSDN